MAREIGWQETKIRFFCRWKYPEWPKSCLRRLGTSLAGVAGRMTSQIAQNVCLFGLCQVFFANVDVQRKLPTTEENAKIQLETISKMCSFWACRPWIKPEYGELNCWDWLTYVCTGLTGLKEKLPELNGQYFYVLLTRDWRRLDFTSFVQSVVACP